MLIIGESVSSIVIVSVVVHAVNLIPFADLIFKMSVGVAEIKSVPLTFTVSNVFAV
jgi:hypothetical protein